MSESWASLRINLPANLVDPLSGLLMELGAEGTWEDGSDLVAYFPISVHRDEVNHALAAWNGNLADCGVTLQTGKPHWEETLEGDWITAWQAHFVPIAVGGRLIVLPEWEPIEPYKDRLPIRIRPGRGFGTGGHDTTALCLKRLERVIVASPSPADLSVLDVGTGSGILAIAAHKLGAGTVTAFDNDPDAVDNARDNLQLNDCNGIELFTGTLDAVTGRYDLILANLLAHLIVEIAPALSAHLAPDGHLILSGLLNDQVDGVDAALAASGLRTVKYESRGMWSCLLAAHETTS
ncbi:MAG: 50S ribosomal protein L11 methyltransferase [Leptospirillia bacterium]